MVEYSKNSESKSGNSQLQDMLIYYKQKVDQLSEERLRWLSKFDQCKSRLNSKHQQQQRLRNLRNNHKNIHRDIVHHSVALLDQTVNTIRADRENLINLFKDAEQRVKIQSLLQQNSCQSDKKLQCLKVGTAKNVIHNELNIHENSRRRGQSSQHKKTNKSTRESIEQSRITKRKVNSPEDLLRQQIIEVRRLNDLQLSALQEQLSNIQQQISYVKNFESAKVAEERNVVRQINTKHKELQKKHKQLAQQYFHARRTAKERQKQAAKENQTLRQTYTTIESKVNAQIKTYQKENKAKQILILKKSEDYQQDYKAKMRAKERNLAALKENYEKMQNIFIQKARKLQATVQRAKMLLQEAQGRRSFLVQQLRDQLKQLQKAANEQRIERIQNELRIRQKAEKEQSKKEEEMLAETKKQKSLQRGRQIVDAYKKTKSPAKSRSKPKRRIKVQVQTQSSEDSLQISDIQNIRNQINELQQKICGQGNTR